MCKMDVRRICGVEEGDILWLLLMKEEEIWQQGVHLNALTIHKWLTKSTNIRWRDKQIACTRRFAQFKLSVSLPTHNFIKTDALPCDIPLPLCLWIMDPHSRAAKKNTSHGIEVLPQDTTNFIQRPCYQRGSPCQDPAGNLTTRRPPDHRKETQTAAV